MSHTNWKSKWSIVRRAASLVLAAAGLVFALPPAAPVYAGTTTLPDVPTEIQVPAGNKLFLVRHAEGTQNYICVPSGAGVKFVLFTPEATLFDDHGKQLITHYFSPNPEEPNADPRVLSAHPIRATWQDSKDSSTVWGQVMQGDSYSTSDYVEPGAIPWLLVTIVGKQNGPSGGDRLSGTTYVQRLNTHGGLAPSTGCTTTEDIGKTAFVPYTTEYYFYRKAK